MNVRISSPEKTRANRDARFGIVEQASVDGGWRRQAVLAALAGLMVAWLAAPRESQAQRVADQTSVRHEAASSANLNWQACEKRRKAAAQGRLVSNEAPVAAPSTGKSRPSAALAPEQVGRPQPIPQSVDNNKSVPNGIEAGPEGPAPTCGHVSPDAAIMCPCPAACTPCGPLLLGHLWVRAEGVSFWTKGAHTPALLTTSSDGTERTKAGVLGESTTSILLGQQDLSGGLQSGFRIAFGSWLDAADTTGVEFTYLGLFQNEDEFYYPSNGSPILARPFYDTNGVANSHIIAYPDQQYGSFECSSSSNFQAAEVLVRRSVARGFGYRFELLGGFRYQRLTDSLLISDTSTYTDTILPAGTSASVMDRFHTQNDFAGVEFGAAAVWRHCQWTFETTMKLAVGQTNSRVDISGATTTSIYGVSTNYQTGMLALSSNEGAHRFNQVSVVPELDLTVGLDLTPRLRATAGCSLIYWSAVARPGDQIDMDLAQALFPPATGTASRPEFTPHLSEYWAAGFHFGLDYRF